MIWRVDLSVRATRDLDRLSRDVQQRIIRRLDQLAQNPFDPRLSAGLANLDLRKSRVGGWRIIFRLDSENRAVQIVTIERRGQVYQRI